MQNKYQAYSRRVRCAPVKFVTHVCVSFVIVGGYCAYFSIRWNEHCRFDPIFLPQLQIPIFLPQLQIPFNYLSIYQAIVNGVFPQPWPHCSTGKKDMPMIFQNINERITVCPKKLYNSAIVNICHSSQKHTNFLKAAYLTAPFWYW